MARFAAVDIGTNTVLLTIADTAARAVVPVLERAFITRLGQGVDRSAELAPDAVTRTLTALGEIASEVSRAGVDRLVVVGTSALRDARGSEAFLLRTEQTLGARPAIISGQLEAELTFEGSVSGLEVAGPVLVFDVGGGSTELVAGEVSREATKIVWSASVNVGSVRQLERIVTHDPPSHDELSQIRHAMRSALAALEPPTAREFGAAPATPTTNARTAVPAEPSRSGASPAAPASPSRPTLVGVAGTVTTLAALARGERVHEPGRLHGASLLASDLRAWAERLAMMTLAERRTLGALEPGRADVIVVGALLVDELLSWAGSDELVVSDRGVRFGVLTRLARGANPLEESGKDRPCTASKMCNN